jgi:vitamin B12 transporter
MRRLVPFGFIVSLLLSLPGLAESSKPTLTQTLTLRVVDPQGAGIPRARLQLTRRDAGFTTEAFADDRGLCRLESIASGNYLVAASAPGFATRVDSITLAGDESGSSEREIRLEIAAVSESVVVTSSKTAQKLSEITKTMSVVDSDEMKSRDEYFIPEAIRTVPGVRVEQLGGPGSFTSIKIRGLRTEDTAILIDGARLRDPSAPQGDASSFIENLITADVDRVEILRGSGSSLHGTNAGGGVINIVTASGGGDPRGSLVLEGGGLGLFRGGAETSGGYRDRLLYSVGVQHVNVSKGVDGDDPARNTSIQGSALFRLTPSTSLSLRVFGADARLGLNESPVTLGTLPSGEIHAVPLAPSQLRQFENGAPLETLDVGNANYIPSADDPDNRRESSFYSTLVTFEQKPSADLSYSLRYHGLVGSRSFFEGPLGTSPYEPFAETSDLFDGRIHTFGARADYDWGRHQTIYAGYELERESFKDTSRSDPSAPGSLTDVSQSSHTLYVQDQASLLDGALSLSGSARGQFFSLDEPHFEPSEGAPYQGATLSSPDDALTGDVSAAYAFVSAGTRLRAHFGSGYRAPSLFERFGASYSTFGYSVYGDPRLPPERTLTFDAGVSQSVLGDRVRLEATYFRTRLSRILVFDFSGAIDPATDPFGRFGGYLSTDGGVTQGLELTSEIAPVGGLDVKASYTYNHAEPPRGVSPDQDQAFAIPRHQFSLVTSRTFGPRLALGLDLYASSSYLAPVLDLTTFASRVYRFDGFVKADLVASYRVPLAGTSLRFTAKVENLFDETIHASGFRTPGRFALVGATFEF